MKRVIEEENLAYNLMSGICNLCKRCEGFREDNDDIFKCRHNKENRGLHSGFVKNHLENYKCKYYKRNSKYITCALKPKKCKVTTNRVTRIIRYKNGKFKSVLKSKIEM